MDDILQVKDLRAYFYTAGKEIPAVDGVSFSVRRGETLCVVGESGCGKSATSMSVMQLIAVPPGKYVSGEILFEGQNLLGRSRREMNRIRGKDISMIFQEPMTALNPVQRIYRQIFEAILAHEKVSKTEAKARSIQLLKMVGVPDAERCAASYPHQLSGGMRQRVMIAMAFACKPKLLIADEPTTALDVTIQAQILALIKQLKDEYGMSVLFITHDLGVVAEIAQRVAVMYSGRIVEEADTEALFREPLHPYTRGLLNCIPRVDRREDSLNVITGQVPNPANFPSGCRFHPRCPDCMEQCRRESPELIDLGGRKVACHRVAHNEQRGEAGA